MVLQGVPVIDAASLLASDKLLPTSQVITQIRDACENWGFFQLVNHGVPQPLLDRTQSLAREFFAREQAYKDRARRDAGNSWGYFNDEFTKQKLDLKEGLDIGVVPHPDLPDDHPKNRTLEGVNRWPLDWPEFKAVLSEYMAEAEKLAQRLLKAFALGLGLAPGELERLFLPQHSSFLRLNFYPRNPPGVEGLGISPHRDAGFLTILVQDGVPGLEVFKDGEWHLVEPLPGAIVINVGDMSQVTTNDIYTAALHRVRPSIAQERLSFPFFYQPCYECDVRPLDACITPDRPAAFRPINWGEFRSKRYAGDYADLGEEVQIDHYRLHRPATPPPSEG